MCGRFALGVDVTKLKQEFPWLELPENLADSYNIAPTQDVAVVTNTGKPRVEFFRWGLVPFWAKDPSIGNKMINARAETLAEKPSFKHAFKRRRCIIFANGYFEWMKQDDGGKQPVIISLKDHDYFAFAGLWEKWKDKSVDSADNLYTCTIVTTSANEELKQYHHRMPVILRPEHIDEWLEEKEVSPGSLTHVFESFPGEAFSVHTVSKEINNPRNNRRELAEPQQQLF